MPRVGLTSQKVLLSLLGGVTLALAGSPRRYSRVLRGLSREWQRLNRQALYRAIRRLYESKLVDYHEQPDGSIQIILNREGRQAALRYQLDAMRITKPERWDGKWRLILFDIPETQKRLRDTLRMRLKQLGLIELQKSAFVHPFACRDEIDFLIEFYQARRYVRFVEATHVDIELHLKHKFNLS